MQFDPFDFILSECRCCSQCIDTFALSAIFPDHGLLFSIMFKCFAVYKIQGLRHSWTAFFICLFSSSLLTTLLYSYSLVLILIFLCSVFSHCFFLSTVKISLFLSENLVKVLGYVLLSLWHTLLSQFPFFLFSLNCRGCYMSPLASRSLGFFTSFNLYLFAVASSATHIFLLPPFFSLPRSDSAVTPGLHAVCLFISFVRQHTLSNLLFFIH